MYRQCINELGFDFRKIDPVKERVFMEKDKDFVKDPKTGKRLIAVDPKTKEKRFIRKVRNITFWRKQSRDDDDKKFVTDPANWTDNER